MDHALVRALYDREMRWNAQPDGPGARVERVGGVVRQSAPPLGFNGVLWSDLDESTADAAIAAQLAHFAGLEGGRTWEWKLYLHDAPADLGARLLAAGLEPEDPETLMVAPVDRLSTEVAPPPGIALVPVVDAAGVDLMMAVHDRAFGGRPRPELRQQLLDLVTGEPERVAAVVAMAGDVPVSSARLEVRPGAPFAGLWGGGTVPEWRGRGIYRALVAYRAGQAAAAGIPYLQVDASDQSRPILERLGFERVGVTVPYVWPGLRPEAGR
ncbi:GNAT family N-acetyltransferase [Streptomyces bambusae]|uniref:GNAT family N-acetyltransferase n=1 Tax=Streptomyces bambusae TaxID=1550616 RepID=UPI001CFDA570|nr:GNAT family N-acetyltransferase [Streptomyces bambusae]MCB5166637.1 GNAT family N-acetyltransferase [Streptomyces bambusae]